MKVDSEQGLSRGPTKWLDHLALALIMALIVGVYLHTRDLRTLRSGADESHYLIHAANFAKRHQAGEGLLSLASNPEIDRGPLLFAITIPFLSMTGESSIEEVRLINLIFWAALIWSVYFLARPLCGRPWVIFAAFAVAVAPSTWEIGCYYNYHLLEAALFCLTLALAMSSRGFSRISMSALAGLAAGLALLSAHAFPALMLAPPLIVCAGSTIKRAGIRRSIVGLAVFLCLASAISCRYLLHYYVNEWARASGYLMAGAPSSKSGFLAYSEVLIVDMLAWPMGLLALLLVPLAIFFGRRGPLTWVLAAAAIPPLCWAGLFGPIELLFNPAYIYPVVPPIVILIAAGVGAITRPWPRRIVCGLMLFFAALIWLRVAEANSALAPRGPLDRTFLGNVRENPMGFHSTAPAYGRACDSLLDVVKGSHLGEISVFFIAFNPEREFMLLDLCACFSVGRPLVPGALVESVERLDGEADPGEVWAVDREKAQYIMALLDPDEPFRGTQRHTGLIEQMMALRPERVVLRMDVRPGVGVNLRANKPAAESLGLARSPSLVAVEQ